MRKWFARLFGQDKVPPPTFGVRGAPRPLTGINIRPCGSADFEPCMRLYAANEPGRFPPDTLPLYAAHLRAARSLDLILEQEGQIIGVGGIGLKSDPEGRRYGWLTFGLIAPSHHRCGLGTALLLARIATLPADVLPLPIFLTAVWRSRSFYEQFGFRLFCRNTDESVVSGYFITQVLPEAVAASRAWLDASGVHLPAESHAIPVTPVILPERVGEMATEHAGTHWLGGTMRAAYACRFFPNAAQT